MNPMIIQKEEAVFTYNLFCHFFPKNPFHVYFSGYKYTNNTDTLQIFPSFFL